MQYFLLVGLGGALGAVARYSVNQLFLTYFNSLLLGTFLANVSGSFVLGLLIGLLSSHPNVPTEARMFIAVGFLGSYTTFSTLSVATIQLLQEGDMSTAVVNLGANIVLGLIAATIGLVVGRLVI